MDAGNAGFSGNAPSAPKQLDPSGGRFMRLADAAQFDLDLANGPSLYLNSGTSYFRREWFRTLVLHRVGGVRNVPVVFPRARGRERDEHRRPQKHTEALGPID